MFAVKLRTSDTRQKLPDCIIQSSQTWYMRRYHFTRLLQYRNSNIVRHFNPSPTPSVSFRRPHSPCRVMLLSSV
jgi:hypothetical protein